MLSIKTWWRKPVDTILAEVWGRLPRKPFVFRTWHFCEFFKFRHQELTFPFYSPKHFAIREYTIGLSTEKSRDDVFVETFVRLSRKMPNSCILTNPTCRILMLGKTISQIVFEVSSKDRISSLFVPEAENWWCFRMTFAKWKTVVWCFSGIFSATGLAQVRVRTPKNLILLRYFEFSNFLDCNARSWIKIWLPQTYYN